MVSLEERPASVAVSSTTLRICVCVPHAAKAITRIIYEVRATAFTDVTLEPYH